MNETDTAIIQRVTFVGLSVDPFEGIPELAQASYGIADELSLWAYNYHIRHDEFEAGHVTWRNDRMLTFKIWRKGLKAETLNPMKYPYKLPRVPWAMKARPVRVRTFLWEAKWYFRLMCEIDDHVRGWAAANRVNLSRLKVAPRWSRHGRIILKLIPDGPMNPRDMLTHHRYEA